eukprot:929615-Amphidinium_carterae.1
MGRLGWTGMILWQRVQACTLAKVSGSEKERKLQKLLVGRSVAGRCAIMASRETVLEKVERNGLFLQFVDEAWKRDHEVVLAAVRDVGNALQYASEALRADRD